MLQAQVTHFSVELPHLRSEYDRLKELGTYAKGQQSGKFLWTFPLKYLREVEIALNGRVIQFNKDQLVRDVLRHCEPLLQMVEYKPETKGKGKLTVSLSQEIDGYKVSWYEKRQLKTALVSKAYIKLLWSAIVQYRVGDEMPSNRVWEDITEHLRLYHWNEPLFATAAEDEEVMGLVRRGSHTYKPSGNFSAKHFYGDRKHYLMLYYNPVKVLVALGLVGLSMSGVTRLAEASEIDNQARLVELDMELEEELQQTPEEPGKIKGGGFK